MKPRFTILGTDVGTEAFTNEYVEQLKEKVLQLRADGPGKSTWPPGFDCRLRRRALEPLAVFVTPP